jgi:hypothetical protein
MPIRPQSGFGASGQWIPVALSMTENPEPKMASMAATHDRREKKASPSSPITIWDWLWLDGYSGSCHLQKPRRAMLVEWAFARLAILPYKPLSWSAWLRVKYKDEAAQRRSSPIWPGYWRLNFDDVFLEARHERQNESRMRKYSGMAAETASIQLYNKTTHVLHNNFIIFLRL